MDNGKYLKFNAQVRLKTVLSEGIINYRLQHHPFF